MLKIEVSPENQTNWRNTDIHEQDLVLEKYKAGGKSDIFRAHSEKEILKQTLFIEHDNNLLIDHDNDSKIIMMGFKNGSVIHTL